MLCLLETWHGVCHKWHRIHGEDSYTLGTYFCAKHGGIQSVWKINSCFQRLHGVQKSRCSSYCTRSAWAICLIIYLMRLLNTALKALCTYRLLAKLTFAKPLTWYQRHRTLKLFFSSCRDVLTKFSELRVSIVGLIDIPAEVSLGLYTKTNMFDLCLSKDNKIVNSWDDYSYIGNGGSCYQSIDRCRLVCI